MFLRLILQNGSLGQGIQVVTLWVSECVLRRPQPLTVVLDCCSCCFGPLRESPALPQQVTPPCCLLSTDSTHSALRTPGDMGIAKDGSHKPTYTPGVDLMAGLTLFGEGCRGSLSEVRTTCLHSLRCSWGSWLNVSCLSQSGCCNTCSGSNQYHQRVKVLRRHAYFTRWLAC
jgi:hypothetical protein